ncbi:ABC transporter ATP-binding protein [Bifidobacterium miconisargentati]|uniref:ABC transporter ATP-binding protein n=1 Tax=Bifidobacterium miconisargentati TaxID=2834437 RepID=UPI003083EE02
MSATPITGLPAAAPGGGSLRQGTPEDNALLTLDHVTKAFAGKDGSPLEILHPTTLTIGHGERIAIVGPSGSGKSTLLSLLGTLDMPTSGTLSYDGEDVAAMGEKHRSTLRAERIGFVFQQFHLIATVSALENVMTGLQYTGLPRRERRAQAAEALEQVGLGERLHHRPSQLSGGEQQRVAIARALAKRPDIIFADEPTGALDTDTGHAIIELLLGAADQGASLVVVTHDPNIAARFPRRLHIQDGVVTELDEGGARHE